jgi:rSAM/selenodomain-associated transferase 1
LILLARWPERGFGKSRLAAALGPDEAYALQRAFLMDTLGWAAEVPNLLIAHTPVSAEADFRRCAPRARLQLQPGGDLGQRIHHAFSDAFALGASRAVIIGSDSPNLPGAILHACLEGLTQADAVVAPTLDGGFCALGLNEPVAALFAGVHWSTSVVFDQMSRNAHTLGLTMVTTASWYDVDDATALRRLRADLALDGAFTPHTAAALARLQLT